MSWFGSGGTPRKSVRGAAPAVATLEIPVSIVTRGMAPSQAIVESLTTIESRVRSTLLLHRDDVVEYDFAVIGSSTVKVRGRVVSSTQNGARFTYRLKLEGMSTAAIDILARNLAQIHRRGVMARAEQRAESLPTTDQLTRAAVRVPAELKISYRTARECFKPASAANLSTGGLLMTCSDALVAGMPLELRMTLPSDVLAAYPEETAVVDMRTRRITSMGRPDLRRAFDEMVLRARVVSHTPLAPSVYSYGVEFVDLDPGAREELSRYVDAAQLARHRRL